MSRELPARRTATSTTYRNLDGTETTAIAGDDVNYRTDDGTWLPIDPTFTRDGPTSWRTTGSDTEVSLSAGSLADVDLGSGHTIGWTLRGGNRGAPLVTDDIATYANVRKDTNIEVQAVGDGAKETIVLRSRRAPKVFDFDLDLDGLTPQIRDGEVVLLDEASVVRGVVPAGWMADAAGITSKDVGYSLPRRGVLRVSIDRAWINAADRAFPVRVDPTMLKPDTYWAAAAMTVRSGGAQDGSQDIYVGGDAQKNRGYIKWNLGALAGHKIFGANLSVVNYQSDSCIPYDVDVREVVEPWSVTPASYSLANAPQLGRTLDTDGFAYGYFKPLATTSQCPVKGSLFELGVRGRDLVQQWANGGANNGLALTAPHGGDRKTFVGPGAAANQPTLYVTHTKYNAAYKIKNPTPSPIVMQNQDGKVSVSVTNTSAMSWGSGAYSLRYRVFDAKGKSYAALPSFNAGAVPALVRGAKADISATIKQMPAGMYYLDFSVVKNRVDGPPVESEVWFTDQQIAPIRIALRIFDVPPVVTQMYPQHGYSAPTLQPQLFARAIDVDSTPDTVRYTFKVCTNQAMTTACFSSAASTAKGWTVPAGKLSWSKQYWWNFTSGTTTSPTLTFFTDPPQPTITSHLAGSDFSSQERDFDPSLGNYSTSAIDASVGTAGPDLTVARTYNSVDPRSDGAFGAGWSTKFDVRAVPATGSMLVRMPTGQEIRFGRNADGSFASPRARDLVLAVSGSGWAMADRASTLWTFDAAGRLTSLKEVSGQAQNFTYDVNGQLDRVMSASSNRGLSFDWTGPRITSVRTVDSEGTLGPEWRYSYDGDALTSVCPPDSASGGACTTYSYTAGSHYRTAVLDSKPDSYWRLGDGANGATTGTRAESEVATNLGKDTAGYEMLVAHGTPGAIANSADTAVTVNGNAAVKLANGAAKKSRDMTVEVWFKTTATTAPTAMPIAGYQNKPYDASTAPTMGVPLLYVGTDGKLRGQFSDGTFTPVTSTGTVTDKAWHHAVLTSVGATTTLYLDGARQGNKTSTINHAAYTYNQIGAGYATTPGSWPAYGTTSKRYFNGALDDAAVYSHGLSAAEVRAHFTAADGAELLADVTLPGDEQSSTHVAYDVENDRVSELTDQFGGTWKLGTPVVAGSTDDIRRTVTVLDPADRVFLYEYDALAGYLLRSASPNGNGVRTEDTAVCRPPSAADPAFCAPLPDDENSLAYWDISGSDVRSMEYDDDGRLVTIYNELGNIVTMKYDTRGNVTARTTCRTWSGATPTNCSTEYTKYPDATSGYSLLDPRWDQPTETRDARSASATDATYLTQYAYKPTGQLAQQTGPAPEAAKVINTYSTGTEPAVGGGTVPAWLPLSTTDAKQAVTSFNYYRTGDLATITAPGGLVTTYTYDSLGRTIATAETTLGETATTTYRYDDMSRLIATDDPVTRDDVNGLEHQQRVEQHYDAHGNVDRTTVSDLKGLDAARVTTYGYDEHNRMTSVTDPLGNKVTYGYDQFGNKTKMIDPNGAETTFAYTAKNKLAEVRLRDPDGTGRDGFLVTAAYAYDAAGRTVATWDSLGRKVVIDYFADDLVAKKTLTTFRRPGETTDTPYVLEEYGYDKAGNVVTEKTGNSTQTVTYVRDEYGRVKNRTVGTGTLTRAESYTYDAVGNVTKVDSTGTASNVPWATTNTSSVAYGYDDAGRATTQSITLPTGTATTRTVYDGYGRPIRVTTPRGMVSGADETAFTTTFDYDAAGRRTKITTPPTANEQYSLTAVQSPGVNQIGYNTYGEVVATRDALGRRTTTEYDARGQVVKQVDPAYLAPGSSTTVTPTTTYSYDANGNATTVTDPRGSVTKLVYDKWGRVVKSDQPLATNDDRSVTSYSYTRTGQLRAVDGPSGRVEQTYDDLDRRVTTSVFETIPSASVLTTKFAYDDQNNITKVVSPTTAQTTSSYDALGQLTALVDPNGVTTAFGYDGAGRQVMVKDALGRTSRTDYDIAGRRTVDAQLSSAGVEGAAQRYTYDVEGNVKTSTPKGARATTYDYDPLGRVTQQIEPTTDTASIATSFGYDLNGNRTRLTDGRGNTTWTTYNAFGVDSVIEPSTLAHPALADRRWQTTYDDGGLPVAITAPGGVTRNRTFDAAGRLTKETGSGAEASTATRDLTYDAAGNLRTLSTPTGNDTYDYNTRGMVVAAAGPSGSASFNYDADGNLTTRSDASGTSTFSYTAGRLSTVNDGAASAAIGFTYDEAGAPKTMSYGAGRVRTFGYDNFGRLASDRLTNSAAASVFSATYGYDDRNRVTRKTTVGVAGASDNTYGYDQAARLTSWTVADGATTTYGWDASGNRTQVNGTTASYDQRNRLVNDGTTDYSWTPRGTVRSRTNGSTTESMTFDAFDRMISQGSSTYRYDAADRIAETGGSTFKYAGLDNDIVSDGTAVYGRAAGGGLLSEKTPSRTRMLVSDQHGDVVAGFDPADTTLSAVPDTRTFDPYGTTTASRGAQSAAGFQGSWTDPTTGDVNMKARWYDSTSGSFTARDTVGYMRGASVLANRYTYGAADPVTQNDPDGHFPSCGFCGDVVDAVANTVSSGASAVASAASAAYHYTTSAASTVYGYASSAAHAVADAATWLYNKAKDAYNYVEDKIADAYNWAKDRISDGIDWARQKAEEARQAAYRAAVVASEKAQAAVEYAAKHNPLPAIAKAVAPVFAGMKSAVSAVANAPAQVVQATVDTVKATAGQVQQIYDKAVKAAGKVVEVVSAAVSKVGDFVKDNWRTIASVVAGIVVGAACTAVTAGAGSVACAMLGTAVSGAVDGALNCPPGQSVASCAGKGAVTAVVAPITDTVGCITDPTVAGCVTAAMNVVPGAAGHVAGKYLGKFRKLESSCNCFAAGTEVATAKGHKPIERVKVGDKVWAKDMVTGKNRLRRVKAVSNHIDDRMMTLRIGGSSVRVTTEHPFHTPGRGWVMSGDLRVGDRISRAHGGAALVSKIDRDATPTRVYNFEVIGDHNYAITDEDLLVHNAACSLSRRSSEIHAAEPDTYFSDRYQTVAVVRFDTGDGYRDVVAASGDGLTDAQLAVPLRAGEVHAENIPGTHAEQNAFLYGNEMGWTPVAGGASRNVCRDTCLPWLTASGGYMRGDVFSGNGIVTTRQRSFGWR